MTSNRIHLLSSKKTQRNLTLYKQTNSNRVLPHPRPSSEHREAGDRGREAQHSPHKAAVLVI